MFVPVKSSDGNAPALQPLGAAWGGPPKTDALELAQSKLESQQSNAATVVAVNSLLEHDSALLDQRISLSIHGKMKSGRKKSGRSETPDSDQFSVQLDTKEQSLYGRLLFLLQFEPRHLAVLASRVSMTEIDPLLETIMFSVYGNQFNSHEEHLLLLLCSQVMANQFESCWEFSSLLRSNTAASRMMTTFLRRGPGQAYLQGTLGPIIRQVTTYSENLDISPLAIFRDLKKANNGDPAYNEPFNIQDAASHPRFHQVQLVVGERYAKLKTVVAQFFDCVCSSVDQVPYGIRWMSKQTRLMARLKFPHATEAQISSLLGGNFFLRFVNPAIVSPQAYSLVEEAPSEAAKRNLTILAKIIQMAANRASNQKQVFTVDISPLLDTFQFKIQDFLNSLCDVPDFYESQEIDHFLSLITSKRQIRIQRRELIELRSLFVKFPADSAEIADILKALEVMPSPRYGNEPSLELPLESERQPQDYGWNFETLGLEEKSLKFLKIKSYLVRIQRSCPIAPRGLGAAATVAMGLHETRPFVNCCALKAEYELGIEGLWTPNDLALLADEVDQECSRLGLQVLQLEDNVRFMDQFLSTAKDRQDFLRSQVRMFQSYLVNVRHSAVSKQLLKAPPSAQRLTFSASELFTKGVLKSWTFVPALSRIMYFQVAKLPGGSYEISLNHREAQRPLVIVEFELDDLLAMKERASELIDLRCCKLAVTPLIAMITRDFI